MKAPIALDGRFVQDHFPGIGRYAFNLIRALAAVAPDQSFVVWHNPALTNTRYDWAALAPYPNVRFERSDVGTFSIREQWQLPPRLRQRRVGLYHSPYYIMPYRTGCPTVVTVHDLLPLRYPGYFTRVQWAVFNLTIRLAIRSARRVIAISEATAGDLRARLKVPADKIVVIPEAADPRFAPAPASAETQVREKYGLPPAYVLAVGINKPHKNLETLVAAWRQTDGAAGALVIAGAWDARYPLPPTRSGSAEVRCLHNLPDDDLVALYSGAQVFVMPSRYEGFGLPVLEAMACGAPVIVAKTSSLPEVAGGAALCFDPDDASALAELLVRVTHERPLANDLRAKSFARAAQFSWERTARETLAAYGETR